ncbi:MAG: hypothetical protein EOP83_19870 [Verrucomicrobiaceae bacterium]|nr:MAG: hypothetical protein EOP83_19870 [Verrucomicrobiaceae bacterium]
MDAPIVAVVWLAMFARVWLGYLEWQSYLALGLAVWVIYVVDRLLDVKLLHADDPRLGPRHAFVKRHQKKLGWLALAAGLGCVFMAFFVLPSRLIGLPTEIGYLVPACVATFVFFSINLASAGNPEIPHVRNLLAGMIFSFGTAMLAHMHIGSEGVSDLALSREMLCFGLLCTVNISAIHFWEHSRQSRDENYQAAHELALTLPLVVLGAACILSAGLDEETTGRPFFYAVLIAAALLFVLNRQRERFSMDALRVLADVALVAPFPVFWLLSSSR